MSFIFEIYKKSGNINSKPQNVKEIFQIMFYRKKCIFILSSLVSLLLIGCQKNIPSEINLPRINLNKNDRVLILAPHPDDEILACAGVIQKAVELKIPIKVVFLTYGDNNEWSFLIYRKRPVITGRGIRKMGRVRREEAINACSELGLSSDALIFLGYPDFRTLHIWISGWGALSPIRGMLSRAIKVPYDSAYRYGAEYKGEEILSDLKDILGDFKPTKIFVSHPSDQNPDHQSFYLFTKVALMELESEISPDVYSYLVHYPNFPKPRNIFKNYPLSPPDELLQIAEWKMLSLNENEIEKKEIALKKHRSQYGSNRRFLVSFIRTNELFGDLPTIVLTDNGKIPKEEIPASPAAFSEHLTDQEKGNFISIEKRWIQLQDDELIISIETSYLATQNSGISFYIFGYRKDKSFAEMPKIHIAFQSGRYYVYDKTKLLPADSIRTERSMKSITVGINMTLLDTPDLIFTNVRTYTEDVPLESASWRIIEIAQ